MKAISSHQVIGDIASFIHERQYELVEAADAKLQIFHGEPFIDRKSVFQAHVAEVHSRQEVR